MSDAFVAVTKHVPAEVNVRAPVPATTEQPDAVPETTPKVTVPVPSPPDVPTVQPVGYIPDVFVTVSEDWLALLIITV